MPDSAMTREPLRFPHLYPNQHLRTLIQRRPHGGSSIAALHIADPHFKQMDPNERRTAEVEWFVSNHVLTTTYAPRRPNLDGSAREMRSAQVYGINTGRTPALPYPPLTIVNRS